jgi:hypothetical protein
MVGAPPPLLSQSLRVWSSSAVEVWSVVGDCCVWWWWEEKVMQHLVTPNCMSGFANVLFRKAVNGLVCVA